METLDHLWFPAVKDLILTENEVHLWRAQLELPISHVHQLRDSLTDDEIDRAQRFSFEIDRQHFIAARGILRSILSRYIPTDPSDLRFYYNHYGKPFLAQEFNAYPLNFSLSHSGSIVLYAITPNISIGVDVEFVRSDFEYEEIAKRFFSVNEAALLRLVPTEKKLEAFYNCWVRKEAYVKAHGNGLSLPLESLEVYFAPWLTKDKSNTPAPWTLVDLKPAPGYMGALAVKGIGFRFRYWDWNRL